ncbi:MAG: histone deacetylase family protein [Candidatus Limnocylindria bacterium]
MIPRQRVILLTDAATDSHASPGHPERPERRQAAADGVRQGTEAAGARLEVASAPPIDNHSLRRVHGAAYLAALDEGEARGGGWLDADTYLVPGSIHAARLAAGATVSAARLVAERGAAVAFAVVRPPGHHAAAGWGSGFCLLNNVALAVAALREEGMVQRIAIVDWDVHHGNGTQAIFEGDLDLFYASTHQWPFYPGTGAREESGGTVQNRPLTAGAGDDDFVAAWRDDLLPTIADFGPHAIIISAGYDAHRSDPLAELDVTEGGFREVARLVGRTAAGAGLAGVALSLEGGYDLAALRASVAASVEGLLQGLGHEGGAGG